MPYVVPEPNGDLKPQARTKVNGYSATNNGETPKDFDETTFQHLPKQQQEVLLLHGPRQKYSLKTTGEVPELKSDREILVQVCEHLGCQRARDVLSGVGCFDWLKSCGLEGTVGVPIQVQ